MKTVFITGATAGFGEACAIKYAQNGFGLILNGRRKERLEALKEKLEEEYGITSYLLPFDVQNKEEVFSAVKCLPDEWKKIDILINNASAISLTPTEHTEPKRFDLMQTIQVRGTFFMCKACIPHLKKSSNGHILNLSPPLNMDPKWFAPHLAYTLSKYGMSMVVLGLAEELKEYKIAANALWPATTIATAAVQNLLGGHRLMQMSRTPEIVADAAYYIISKPSAGCTGNFFIDEDVLGKEGITDLTKYAVDPDQKQVKDLFLD